MRGEEVRSYADRRRAARGDGDRVRGHGAAEARGQPVLGTRITALFSPKNGEARIGFRLRREEDIRLDIVDDNGTIVRHALGTGVFGQAFHQFAWDGRNDAGRIVPDGLYHVQLELKDEDRTIEFPSTVRVDSTPPTIQT